VGITKLFQLNSDFENLRWVAGALSVGLTSAFMGLTNTIHPPAGATALLAATTPEITELGWFFLPLILLGSVLLVAVGCVTNNIQRQFPIYVSMLFLVPYVEIPSSLDEMMRLGFSRK
jgi:CBS-domain-containing membrane protein